MEAGEGGGVGFSCLAKPRVQGGPGAGLLLAAGFGLEAADGGLEGADLNAVCGEGGGVAGGGPAEAAGEGGGVGGGEGESPAVQEGAQVGVAPGGGRGEGSEEVGFVSGGKGAVAAADREGVQLFFFAVRGFLPFEEEEGVGDEAVEEPDEGAGRGGAGGRGRGGEGDGDGAGFSGFWKGGGKGGEAGVEDKTLEVVADKSAFGGGPELVESGRLGDHVAAESGGGKGEGFEEVVGSHGGATTLGW